MSLDSDKVPAANTFYNGLGIPKKILAAMLAYAISGVSMCSQDSSHIVHLISIVGSYFASAAMASPRRAT